MISILMKFQAEQQKYEMLDDDDIEGQEDETIARDGEIQITPFNLKEEQVKHFKSQNKHFVIYIFISSSEDDSFLYYTNDKATYKVIYLPIWI